MPIIGDLLIIAIALNGLMILVHSTKRFPAVAEWRWTICLLGVAWLLWAGVRDVLTTQLLGIPLADALHHERIGRELAAALLAGEDVSDHLRLGNPAYQLWLGILFALTNCSRMGADLINGFLAFWGSLVLLSICSRQVPDAKIPGWLVLVILMLPSALYWAPTNLKEGPMYWGIIQTLSMVLLYRRVTVIGSMGVAVMILMRPHVALIWVASLGGALLLSPRHRVFAIGALLGTVLLLSVVGEFVGRDLQSFDDIYEEVEERADQLRYGGSGVEKDTFPEVLILSGLVTIFLRPLPWEIHSFPAALAAVEVYSLTALLLVSWWRLDRWIFQIRQQPAILVALVAVLLFAIIHTYTGNLGLMARQRLQIVPAIFILFAIPVLLTRLQAARYTWHNGNTGGDRVQRESVGGCAIGQ